MAYSKELQEKIKRQLAESKAMLAQHKAQGAVPFKGSSYDVKAPTTAPVTQKQPVQPPTQKLGVPYAPQPYTSYFQQLAQKSTTQKQYPPLSSFIKPTQPVPYTTPTTTPQTKPQTKPIQPAPQVASATQPATQQPAQPQAVQQPQQQAIQQPQQQPQQQPIKPQVGVATQHKVRTGETLSSIAQRYGVPVSAISGYRSNDPNLIYPDEMLDIQAPQQVQAQAPVTPPMAPPMVAQQGPITDPSGATVSQEGAIIEAPEAPPEEVEQFSNQYGFLSKQLAQGFTQNPTQMLTALIDQVMRITGLPDARENINNISKEIEEIENERDDKIAEIQDNPWVSAGTKQGRTAKIRDKYEQRLSNRINRLTLMQNAYQDARNEVRFAVTTGITLFNQERNFQADQLEAELEREEKRLEAERKMGPLTTETIDGFTVLRDAEGDIVSTMKPQVGKATPPGVTPSKEPSNPLKLTTTQLNKGIIAAGDTTHEDFLNRSVEEQQSFVFGQRKTQVGGRLAFTDLTKMKISLRKLVTDGFSKKEISSMLEEGNLPAADNLELWLLLDELFPPEKKWYLWD
ncbi:MAG: LysM peptidoglycan-binding domain-containing protein [Bacteroidetes bacterium]|nr:LysM peptidoglycan-binding domain-containing protein [Bacteroidota bacterium]